MMKLTLMKQVVDTLNSNNESPVADKVLSFWEHDPDPAREYRFSANFIFTFNRGGIRQFLRFNPQSERTREGIQAELDYLDYLSKCGIPVARPVRSLVGNCLESVETDIGLCHAVVFDGLQGKQHDVEDLDESMFRVWGKALGRLHQASQEYAIKTRQSWEDHLAMASATIPQNDIPARKELRYIGDWLASLNMDQENYGLCHWDFEQDNLYWNEGSISILDFDESTFCWYVADVAFALRDLFKGNIDFENPNYLSFMQGYETQKRAAPSLLRNLPLFQRMHDLLTYARLLHALEGSSSQSDKEWARLWEKLTAHVRKYQQGFAKLHQ